MPPIYRYKLGQQLAIVAIGGAAMFVANSGMAQAAYGPPRPPTSVPGGYYCVVTSQTVSHAGKFIGPLGLNGLGAGLKVRGSTFAGPVQITITEPFGQNSGCQSGPAIGNAGFPGYSAVGGVGILVQLNGSDYRGTFPHPLALRLASPSITRSSLVVVWNGRRFVTAPHAVLGRQSASVQVNANSDLAVLMPTRKRPGPDTTTALRGGSAPATGTPGPGGELLAALFLWPANSPLPGIGVTAPAWLPSFGTRGHGASLQPLTTSPHS